MCLKTKMARSSWAPQRYRRPCRRRWCQWRRAQIPTCAKLSLRGCWHEDESPMLRLLMMEVTQRMVTIVMMPQV
ncbi:unnamed protein product [Symbiodinium sp. CCMP2592]|nr:unnamed protein product [Symbiodinium sp. CCMP2592]